MIPEEIQRRLRWVRADDPSLTLADLPDFFIVGPQRTGTTWLHANLRWHPEIFLAEPKEIFFFNRLGNRDDPKFQSEDLAWYVRFFRPPLWLSAVEHAMALRHHRRPYRPRVRGEATASYAAMEDDRIGELATLVPRARVIMMVRHPVERAWSHAKKDLARNAGRAVEDVADDEWHAFFSDPYQLRCAHHSANLARWRRHFADEQILVLRHDDVGRIPETLLARTMDFLGVSSGPRYIGTQARETVNPTSESRIPERHRLYLEELLAEALRDWRDNWAGDDAAA